MLMANNMLQELNKDIHVECKSDNDDIDFGTVLAFCSTSSENHKIRCSDGEERIFSFDK